MSLHKSFQAGNFSCIVAFTTTAAWLLQGCIDDSNSGSRENDQSHARIDDSNSDLRENHQSHAGAFVQSVAKPDTKEASSELNGRFPPFPVVNNFGSDGDASVKSAVALFKIKDSYKATLSQDHQAQFDDLSFLVFEKTDAWQSVFNKQESSHISAGPDRGYGKSLRFGHRILERAFPLPTKAAGSEYPVCRLNPKTAARLTTPDGVLEFLQETIPPAFQKKAAQIVTDISDQSTLAELLIKFMRKCPLWAAHTILQPAPVADSIDASDISDKEILKILSHLLLVKEKNSKFLWRTPIADCVGNGSQLPFVSMAVHNVEQHIDIQHQSNIPAASFLDLSLQDFMPEMAVHVSRPRQQKDSGLYAQEHRFTERIWLNNLVRWKNNKPVAKGLSVYVHCAAFLAFDKGDDRPLSESSYFKVFPDGFTHMYNLFMSLKNLDGEKVMDSIPGQVIGKGVQSKREFEQFCRERLEVIRVLKPNEWN